MKSIYLFWLILLIGCNTTQNTIRTLNNSNNPGSCYAKYVIPDKYLDQKIEHYIYTGTDFENEFVSHEKIEVIPATTEWVKKKADKNCLSANPDDCLVWCLMEIPAVVQENYFVIDTNMNKEFEIKTITQKKLIQKGGAFEYKEVVCEPKKELITRIQDRLYELEYYNFESDGKWNRKTSNAFQAFQKDYDLPIGGIDFETLDYLGLEY